MTREVLPVLLTLGLTIPAGFGAASGAQSQATSKETTTTTAATASNGEKSSLARGTAILAKLATSVDAHHLKVGDRVEAEATRDIHVDHDTTFKKGARVIGHVTGVTESSKDKPESRVAIVFDSISDKSGKSVEAPLVIQALAPEPNIQQATDVRDGRGLAATQISAATLGGEGGKLEGGELRPENSGVYGIPGVSLVQVRTDQKQTTVLISAKKNVQLAKGTQMVLRVPGD